MATLTEINSRLVDPCIEGCSVTPIQLRYQTAGSPGPGVAMKSGTHWPETQTEATALGVGLGRECRRGRPCCAVLGLARQPRRACTRLCPGLRDPETRWSQVAGLDRCSQAEYCSSPRGFGEQPSSTGPITRRAAAPEVGTAREGAGGSRCHCRLGQQGLLTGLSPNGHPQEHLAVAAKVSGTGRSAWPGFQGQYAEHDHSLQRDEQDPGTGGHSNPIVS